MWRLQNTGTFKETLPVLDASGHLESKEVEREVGIDIALRWGTGYDTKLKTSSTSWPPPMAAPTSPGSNRPA